MEASYSIVKGIGVIHVSGQFGYSDEKRLTDMIDTLASEGVPVIAVDTTRLDYVNSLGVGAFFSMMRRADELSCEFVVYGMNPNVLMVLEKVFEKELVPLLTVDDFNGKYLT
jgi:anti-anti-sigma factor